MNTTYFALMAEFGSAAVELDKVSSKYFGLSPAEAKRRANRHQLPVLAYRSAESQKAPMLVNVADLAIHLDNMREKALREFKAVNE